MLEKMLEIGNRWTKAGKDRIYVNLDTIGDIEYDGVATSKYLNARERRNVKIYWDVETEQLVITGCDDDAQDAIRYAIATLTADDEEQETEETEETEETKIATAINDGEYEYYGIRADDTDYNVGDICKVSHQWYQDPISDDWTIDSNNYNPAMGCWDDGELDGTCAIQVDSGTISKALQAIRHYHGGNVYLIAGDIADGGEDIGEIVISDAVVLLKM